MKIGVKSNVEQLRREINAVRSQVPYAAKLAIDACLKKSATEIRGEMVRVFDRPTPWTLNSIRVTKWPTKRELTGIVGFKDVDYRGGPGGRAYNAAGVYLQPLMDGAPRAPKGLERLLRARGILGANEFLVPSKYQKLDQYGNVPRGTVQKILSNLKATFDPKSYTPSGGARGGRKKADYFFTRRGLRGQRVTAIWQRFPGGHVVPAFIVVTSAPRYTKRFDLVPIVKRVVETNFNAEFESGYAKAVQTAK